MNEADRVSATSTHEDTQVRVDEQVRKYSPFDGISPFNETETEPQLIVACEAPKVVTPPSGYKIGDIYLKLKLENEAKALEDRVNSYKTHGRGLRKRESILEKAAEDYESRLEQSKQVYKASMIRFDKSQDNIIELEHIGTLIPPDNMFAQMESQERIEEAKNRTKLLEKVCFDNYTTMRLYEVYTKRIKQELLKIQYRNPSAEFKILRDSDQLI